MVHNLSYAPDLNGTGHPAYRADMETAARRPLKRIISQQGWILNREALQQLVNRTFHQLAGKLVARQVDLQYS